MNGAGLFRPAFCFFYGVKAAAAFSFLEKKRKGARGAGQTVAAARKL